MTIFHFHDYKFKNRLHKLIQWHLNIFNPTLFALLKTFEDPQKASVHVDCMAYVKNFVNWLTSYWDLKLAILRIFILQKLKHTKNHGLTPSESIY